MLTSTGECVCLSTWYNDPIEPIMHLLGLMKVNMIKISGGVRYMLGNYLDFVETIN